MNSKRLDSEGGERLFIICSILLIIISVTPIQASATSAFGIVRVAPPFSICMQGDTHYLEDPCDGSLVTRLSSDTIDLNWYLDQYVEVEGTEIGVECSIINVQNIDILPAPPCLPSECSTWTDVVSKYNAYVSGQSLWDEVITCYQQFASSQYTISGTVSDNAYVLMELSGPVTMTRETDYDGSYSFTGLSNGTYTVTPSKSVCPDCYFISPSSQTVTINEASISGVDFSPMCVPCDLVSTNMECIICMYSCYLSGACSWEEYDNCNNTWCFSSVFTY